MLRKSHVKGRSRTLVFLALMMSVLLVLAACGGQQAEAPASEPAAAEEAAAEPTEAPAEEATEEEAAAEPTEAPAEEEAARRTDRSPG